MRNHIVFSTQIQVKGSPAIRKTVKKGDNVKLGGRGVTPSTFLAQIYRATKTLGLCTLEILISDHQLSYNLSANFQGTFKFHDTFLPFFLIAGLP